MTTQLYGWFGALAPFASWLGTYAVHATLAVLLALLLSRFAGRRHLLWQERMLRWSLLLPLASATLQWAVFGSTWAIPGPMAGAVLDVAPATLPATAILRLSADLPAPSALPPALPLALGGVVVSAALLAAVGGIAWLASQWLRLRRVLRSRAAELDPRVLGVAAETAHHCGMQCSPHISRSALLTTPIAFGLLRQEVCLPARVDELDDGMLRAMLGHELAHLRRADAAWMWAVAAIQAVFPWLLPLCWGRRAWARVVELRCDAAAAEHAGGTDVARCLLEVAEWLRPGRAVPLTAFAMAARPSALRERVEAMLNGVTVGRPRRGSGLAFAFGSLTSLTVMAPGWPAAAQDPARPVPVFADLFAHDPDVVAPDRIDSDEVTILDEGPADDELLVAMELLEAEHAEIAAEAAELEAMLASRRDRTSQNLLALLRQRLSALAVQRARLSGWVLQRFPSSLDPQGEER